jgi:hypothetical protein
VPSLGAMIACSLRSGKKERKKKKKKKATYYPSLLEEVGLHATLRSLIQSFLFRLSRVAFCLLKSSIINLL